MHEKRADSERNLPFILWELAHEIGVGELPVEGGAGGVGVFEDDIETVVGDLDDLAERLAVLLLIRVIQTT